MNPEPLYIVESTGFPYYQRVLVPNPRHWIIRENRAACDRECNDWLVDYPDE